MMSIANFYSFLRMSSNADTRMFTTLFSLSYRLDYDGITASGLANSLSDFRILLPSAASTGLKIPFTSCPTRSHVSAPCLHLASTVDSGHRNNERSMMKYESDDVSN